MYSAKAPGAVSPASVTFSHWLRRPSRQVSHTPQDRTLSSATSSPGLTLVTWSPVWATTPAASCPKTTGSAIGPPNAGLLSGWNRQASISVPHTPHA